MTIRVVYVAGPYSAKTREGVEANIRRAELLGLEVAKLGACPLIPHTNTSAPEFEAAQPYTFWIDATAELLRRCDAVIFTPDWGQSSGARGENLLAAELLMPMFYTMEALADWLKRMASIPADREARAEMATIPPVEVAP